MSEIWLPVVSWPGLYEVSSEGRVRSLPRISTFSDGRSRKVPGRILRGNVSGHTYRRVGLSDGSRREVRYVHHLVAEAFLGPRPDGFEVRHVDGDPLGNAASNLTYGTSSENNYDIVRHGRHFHALKTECPRGHAYDAENTRVYNGRRFCNACSRARRVAA